MTGMCALAPTAGADNDLLVLLDSSSRLSDVQSNTPFSAIQTALVDALPAIPSGTAVGLRSFGHRFPQTDKASSCADSELVVPLGPLTAPDFSGKVLQIKAQGFTPLTLALGKVEEDLDPKKDANRVVVLLSTGEDNCGADPVIAVKKLMARGFRAHVHVIGIGVSTSARTQLKQIAEAGSGSYVDAANGSEVKTKLMDLFAKAFASGEVSASVAVPIRGGEKFESAVPLKLNQEYRLDHHLKRGQSEYFTVALQAGEELTTKIKTLESGLDILADGRTIDSGSPYMGLAVVASTRTQLKRADIIGKKFAEEELKLQIPRTGNYYIVIGSDFDEIHKDHHSFEVSVLRHGDLDGDNDAGDRSASALPITPKKYLQNFIGGRDSKDVFSFEAKAGAKVVVGVIPDDGFSNQIQVRLFDDYKKTLLSQSAAAIGEGFKTDPVTIPADGSYYLEVAGAVTSDVAEKYALEFLLQEPAAPSPTPDNSGDDFVIEVEGASPSASASPPAE